jgi:GT2 family glycosyltransferase
MSPPEISVVVASVNGFPYLGACLDALQATAPWAEVVVADSTDEPTRERVREGWPAVALLPSEGRASVPALRARGIAAAAAPYVALIEDHCVVRPGWAAGLLAHHRLGRPVVGGPIANAVSRRARDRAAFYCEYSAFLEPVTEGPAYDLPGMNVSYDRTAIDAMQDLLDEGRWETWLHPRLRERGIPFWMDPALTIDHAKDFGLREFTSQRYHYARSYAGERSEQLGPRRLAYALGTPLLPLLLGRRILGNVRRSGEDGRSAALAAPLVAWYLSVWAAGEAVGYLAGGGDSLLEVR